MSSPDHAVRVPTLHRMRSRGSLVVLGLVGALVTGCTAGAAPTRTPGDAVTQAEAEILARLLERNHEEGGADFVVTAPYREGVVLTLTGEVDFRDDVGRAQALTTFGDGREDDVRTLFFTPDTVWTGDVPGLREALAATDEPDAEYMSRPMTTADDVNGPLLTDVLLGIVLGLSAPSADEAESFLGEDYTWRGQRSIDSRLASLFGIRGERTVAVAAADDLLLQFVTPLHDDAFDATITLSDHGPRTVEVPTEAETAEAADHPEIAAALGV
mgnify:CR=1 FL=1